MSRFARHRRVYFVEEPLFDAEDASLQLTTCPQSGVKVATPHLSSSSDPDSALEALLTGLVSSEDIQTPVVWFYTPMALEFFPRSLSPSAVVYDCMDELSGFRGAPPKLQQLERRLLNLADVVFTGGVSLFEAKRSLHRRIHPFPSGVDIAHFMQARNIAGEVPGQEGLGRPRLGFAGVIDERMDLALLDEAAALRPAWQFLMIGPTVKIPPDSLPRRSNIHWLGMKSYADLPGYFAGWDIGIMPFALNDSTKFISPTKTPEYLAAGLPVVSTPIRDVVRPYGELGLVQIAGSAAEFVSAAEESLIVSSDSNWRERVDEFLRTQSWDSVWSGMDRMIAEIIAPDRFVRSAGAPILNQEPARV